MPLRYLIVLVFSLTVLTGCSLAPNYQQPDLPVENAWPHQSLAKAQTSDIANADTIGWRDFFTDPELQRLLTTALENNRDLRIAVLNIQRARAQYRIQRADIFPHLQAGGAGQVQRISGDLSGTGESFIDRQYSSTFGLSTYEIDLFGKIQSLSEEALQNFLATEEAKRSTHITLLGEVANAYLMLIADRERLNIAKETLVSQQASYDMIKRRYDAGVSSELDLKQAQTSVDSARVDIARYTGLVATDLNALSLLVGSPVTDASISTQALTELAPWRELPVGLPAEVLLKRPDIRQYEHLLQAANANIGAARARFFPSITLTAALGTASNDIQNLFSAGTGMWNFLPNINLPIFTAGQNMANLRVSEANRDIAVAEYERAIQNGFREVADNLALRATLTEQLNAQKSLLNATTDAYNLSFTRYEKGIDSYLVVLDSQRAMYTAQINLVTARATRDANMINLYKSLGGGLHESSITQTTTP